MAAEEVGMASARSRTSGFGLFFACTAVLFAVFLLPVANASDANDIICNLASEPCHTGCCSSQHGVVGDLTVEGVPVCVANPTKCIIIGQSGSGALMERQACVLEAYAPDFNLDAYAACYQECMRNAGCTWDSSDSPFIGPRATPEEQTPVPEDACSGVVCPRECKIEGGRPMLYQDGTCRVNANAPAGYECLYVKAGCIWECNSDGTNCNDAQPLEVTIDTPRDEAYLDTGGTDVATVDVTGSISSSPGHTVSQVLVFTTLRASSPANFNAATGTFSLTGLQIRRGRPVDITVTAFDERERVLGTKTVTVYPSPKMISLTLSATECTIYRNGEQIGQSVTSQEGDTFEIQGSNCNVRFTYSDGTTIAVKAPAKLQYWEKGIYLRKGTIEVNVNHDYEVLTKLARYVVRGTNFKVTADEESSAPEAIVVIRGSVDVGAKATSGYNAIVTTGQKLVVLPNVMPGQDQRVQATQAELLGIEQGGEAPATGDEGGGTGGCGSGLIILFSLAALGFVKRSF